MAMNGVIRWAVVLVSLGAAGVASAQPPAPAGPPPQRPTFSPYLNLLRPGGSPAQNYYGLVRPEQQFRQSIGSLQGQVNANQQAIGNLQTNPADGPAVTGHPVYFLNTGGYFQNTVGGSVGRGGVNRPAGPQAGGAVGVPPPRR
jgi:hypothetical protein